MDAFSRQVAVLEKNKYVRNLATLNSSLGQSARVEFNVNLLLDQSIFNYISVEAPPSSATALPVQPSVQPGQTTAPAGTPVQSEATPNSEKLITAFHFLLTPEVVGVVDQNNYTITLSVPYGTDVKNLTPSLVISPGATVLPSSNAPQDFTNPVTYMITAQDGSVQSYKVSVVVSAPPVVVAKTSQPELGILIIVILVCAVLAIIAVVFLLIRKKNKQK